MLLEDYLVFLRAAGLMVGYLLTSAELGGSKIQVHGPRNLNHFLATFRNYLFR
jgi:hypothetical protein